MRDEREQVVAGGVVRVACVDLDAFTPRDLPAEVLQMVRELPRVAAEGGARWV